MTTPAAIIRTADGSAEPRALFPPFASRLPSLGSAAHAQAWLSTVDTLTNVNRLSSGRGGEAGATEFLRRAHNLIPTGRCDSLPLLACGHPGWATQNYPSAVDNRCRLKDFAIAENIPVVLFVIV